MTETFIVTGVSGYVGRRIAELVIDQVDASRVIVTSRDRSCLEEWRAKGASARYADYADPESLAEAFAGGTRAVLISSLLVGARRRAQHQNAITAFAAAGVGHVIYTSFLGAGDPDSDALVSEDHAFTENALRASGMSWTFLRNSQYADAVAEQVGGMSVASGECIHNSGDGETAYVSRDDVAAVAAAVLLGAGSMNTAYDVTGPELHTWRQLAALLAEVSGRPVREVALTDDEMYAMWDSVGVPRQASEDPDAPVPWCSDDMVSFGRYVRQGGLAVVTDAVEQLTGRPAEPLRSVIERYAHTWQVRTP